MLPQAVMRGLRGEARLDQALKEQFREQLPPSCPPPAAAVLTSQTLMRLVPSDSVIDAHFDSYAAQKLECTIPDKECEWASCSMMLPSTEKHRITSLLKFKRLKEMKYLAYVDVSETSGQAIISETKHVDFWFFRNTEPTSLVQKTVKVDDYEPQ